MARGRVLIVLDGSFEAPGVDIPQWARRAVLETEEVHVIAPYIGSRLSVATDDDEPHSRASHRLEKGLIEKIRDATTETVQGLPVVNT